MRKGQRFGLILILGFLALIFPAPGQAEINELDSSFNNNGYTTHTGAAGGTGTHWGRNVHETSSGKYIVCGYGENSAGNNDLIVWRYNHDGTLDTSFNSTGYVSYGDAAGGDDLDIVKDCILQDDGKIIIAGSSKNSGGNEDLAVWRLNDNGSLDTTFNSVGYFTHASAGGYVGHDRAEGIALQPDGKYVVAGLTADAGGKWDMSVWRLRANGTLDSSFNSSGYATHGNAAGGNSWDVGYDVDIQSDGKILITGTSYNGGGMGQITVWRYTTAGILDTTFNGSGYKSYTLPGFSSGEGTTVRPLADGHFLVAGNAGASATVIRLTEDGSYDTSFNSVGYIYHSGAAGADGDKIMALKVQSDGKYVSVGSGLNASGNYDLVVWRHTPDGSLDTTFFETGYATHGNAAGGDSFDWGEGMIIDNHCRYVVAGISKNDSGVYDMTLWRYQNLFQVNNLDPDLQVKYEDNDIRGNSANGVTGSVQIAVYFGDTILSDLQTTFVSDLDWSMISGKTDLINKKAFIHTSGAAGINSITLYVPKGINDDRVGICPGAASLEAVGENCTDLEYYTEDESRVSIVSLGGQDYFKIADISGTGGFSSHALAETGSSIQQILAFGLIVTSGTFSYWMKDKKQRCYST